jgi:hypothetical protein
MDKLLGIGGERYQTFPERAVRGAVDAGKNMVDAAKIAPAGSRAATEAMVGPSFEAAETFSPMGVAGTVEKAAVKSLGSDELRTAAKEIYKSKKFDDVEIKPTALAGLRNNILTYLQGPGESYRTTNAKATFDALEELTNPFGRTKPTDTPTLRDVLVVRDLLKNVPYGTPDGTAAMKARKMLENYLNNLPADHITKGDPASVRGLLSDADKNYAASKKLDLLSNQERKGEQRAQVSGKGGNMDNAVRQRILEIRNNPAQLGRFSPDEIAKMDKIIKGSPIGNAARWLSFLDPTKHATTAIPSVIAGDLAGGAGVGTGLAALGFVAQKLSERQTRAGVSDLTQSILEKAPANAGRAAPKPKAMSPAAWRAMLVGATPPPPIVQGNDPFNPLTNPNAL